MTQAVSLPVTGQVLRIGVKPQRPGERGLPKSSVRRVEVTPIGAAGDYNHYRTMRLSGDLDQALLLLTDEVLEQLRTEGWPVEPGDLGENVTLTGISEGCLGPGARLRFGEALVEITIPCDPCTELYVLPYVGPGRGPAFIRTLAGRRGWYARVLQVGTIEVGMIVELAHGTVMARPTP